MATRIRTTATSPGLRRQLGATVLSGARTIDTSVVKERLAEFARMHRTYVGAQQKVEDAEAALAAAQTRLDEPDAVLHQAVEAIARELVAIRAPRRNPFGQFRCPAPSRITRLPFAEEVKEVRNLLSALHRAEVGVNEATLAAVLRTADAARAVEELLGPFTELREAVREARRQRDALARRWDTALAALRRDCRAAADAGAPELYSALFPSMVRVPAKKAEPPAQAAAGEAPVAQEPPAA